MRGGGALQEEGQLEGLMTIGVGDQFPSRSFSRSSIANTR